MTLDKYLEHFNFLIDSNFLKENTVFWQQLNDLWNQINWQNKSNLKTILKQIQNLIESQNLNWQELRAQEIIQTEKENLQNSEEVTKKFRKNLTDNLEVLTLKPVLFKGMQVPKVINNKEELDNLTKDLLNYTDFQVVNLKQTEEKYKPNPPFITSTLQQSASTVLGFNPKQTMEIAQKLYEGVLIDQEPIALITYMRTDSVNLSQEAINKIRQIIKIQTPEFLPQKPNYYQSRKTAQEAHEAIRPTDPFLHPEQIKSKLDSQLWKVYNLIWQRTIACQMTDYVLSRIQFSLENKQKTVFNGYFNKILSLGWKYLYQKEDLENLENILKQKWLNIIQESLKNF